MILMDNFYSYRYIVFRLNLQTIESCTSDKNLHEFVVNLTDNLFPKIELLDICICK